MATITGIAQVVKRYIASVLTIYGCALPGGCDRVPSSLRLVGGVASKIGKNVVSLEYYLVGAQRHLAGRRDYIAGRHMEGAHMHAALDHVTVEQALSKARGRVGAFQ
jgi:hypothetical protein